MTDQSDSTLNCYLEKEYVHVYARRYEHKIVALRNKNTVSLLN